MKTYIVVDKGKLRALEKAGHIKEAKWGFYPYVECDDSFWFKGEKYAPLYIDGSFSPVLECLGRCTCGEYTPDSRTVHLHRSPCYMRESV